MGGDIRIEKGSGNIFSDLGFSDEEAKVELLKAQLGAEIARLKAELNAVYESPTWQVGSTTHRVLKKGGRRIGKLLGRED